MAGDWIPMRVRLWEADEVIGIASDLNLDEYAVVGRLLKLWGWASEMSRDGRARNVTDVWIDRYVSAPGFAQALEKQGWLDLSSGGMAVVDFERWNSENARKRLKNADRQRRLRAKTCRVSRATNALPEKRREENIDLPPIVPQGDEKVDRRRKTKPEFSDEQIQAIFDAYPSRRPAPLSPRMPAFKAIRKALTKIGYEELLNTVQAYAQTPDVRRRLGTPDAKYIPQAATWFNQERWADVPPPEKPNPYMPVTTVKT